MATARGKVPSPSRASVRDAEAATRLPPHEIPRSATQHLRLRPDDHRLKPQEKPEPPGHLARHRGPDCLRGRRPRV